MRYCPNCRRMVNAQKRSASAKLQVGGYILGGLAGVGLARHLQPKECPICGTELFSTAAPNVYCTQCHAINTITNNYCIMCGNKIFKP